MFSAGTLCRLTNQTAFYSSLNNRSSHHTSAHRRDPPARRCSVVKKADPSSSGVEGRIHRITTRNSVKARPSELASNLTTQRGHCAAPHTQAISRQKDSTEFKISSTGEATPYKWKYYECLDYVTTRTTEQRSASNSARGLSAIPHNRRHRQDRRSEYNGMPCNNRLRPWWRPHTSHGERGFSTWTIQSAGPLTKAVTFAWVEHAHIKRPTLPAPSQTHPWRLLTKLQKARLRHWLLRTHRGASLLRAIINEVKPNLARREDLLELLKRGIHLLAELPLEGPPLYSLHKLPHFAMPAVPRPTSRHNWVKSAMSTPQLHDSMLAIPEWRPPPSSEDAPRLLWRLRLAALIALARRALWLTALRRAKTEASKEAAPQRPIRTVKPHAGSSRRAIIATLLAAAIRAANSTCASGLQYKEQLGAVRLHCYPSDPPLEVRRNLKLKNFQKIYFCKSIQ